jgi:apolipoprotein N-acyltransferase
MFASVLTNSKLKLLPSLKLHPAPAGFFLGVASGLCYLFGWPLFSALILMLALKWSREKGVPALLLLGAGYMVGSSTWFFPGTGGPLNLFIAILGTALLGLIFHGLPHLVLLHKRGWLVWPFLITLFEFIAEQIGAVGVSIGLLGLKTPLAYFTTLGSLYYTSIALGFILVMPVAIKKVHPIFPAVCLSLLYLVGLPFVPKALPIDIGYIRHNPPSGVKWEPEKANEILESLIERSKGFENVDLIVWPENAITTTFNLEEAIEQVREVPKPLLFGMTRYMNAGQPELLNSAILLEGEAVTVSDKLDRVPLIEGGLGPLVPPSIHAGERKIFELENGIRFLTLLCYEVSFQIPKKDLEGVDFILVISAETGLFTNMTAQVYDWQAAARALETGLPILRVGDAVTFSEEQE